MGKPVGALLPNQLRSTNRRCSIHNHPYVGSNSNCCKTPQSSYWLENHPVLSSGIPISVVQPPFSMIAKMRKNSIMFHLPAPTRTIFQIKCKKSYPHLRWLKDVKGISSLNTHGKPMPKPTKARSRGSRCVRAPAAAAAPAPTTGPATGPRWTPTAHRPQSAALIGSDLKLRRSWRIRRIGLIGGYQ